MKFPITRECLQAFDYVKEQEEKMEEAIQKRFTKILDELCGAFMHSMPSNSKEKKFVWHGLLQNIRQFHIQGYIGTNSKIDYLPQFIEKLKEVFIGCDIIIDPLKTYLIIDWS